MEYIRPRTRQEGIRSISGEYFININKKSRPEGQLYLSIYYPSIIQKLQPSDLDSLDFLLLLLV